MVARDAIIRTALICVAFLVIFVITMLIATGS